MNQSKRLSVSMFCAVMAFALVVPAAMAKKPENKSISAAIMQLETDGVKANLSGDDAAWITKHNTDDYTMGTSWGAFETKQTLLKDAADKANNKSTTRDVSDMAVRVYGNSTAIATYKESYDIMVRGEHRTRKILTTDTWVNEKGMWKLAASHSSQADQKIGD
ncbi:MAG: hypothetical protein NVS9B15_04630 [Acidobacteriaceae bacterium]